MARRNRYDTHGMTKHPLYQTWIDMRRRCENPKNKVYKHYGARGITVCERWQNFADFVADMGDRPDGTTLERREGHKGYEPDNCFWATPEQQNNNRRNVKLYAHAGKTLSLAQWSRELGLNYQTIFARAQRELPISEILKGGHL